MKAIKPATNYKELPNVFLPNYVLQQKTDEAFYVPVYEEEMDDLRDKILNNNIRAETIFISGQTGTGKTTALNFLPNDEIRAEYEVIGLNAKDLFDLADINIIEVLLMICYKLMKREGRLKEEFLKEIERLDKFQKGLIKEEIIENKGVSGNIGFGLKSLSKFLQLFKSSDDFFANLRADASYRKITREAFQLNKLELLKLTNRMIEKFIEWRPRKSKILLLINEMDHIKKVELIEQLFVENRTFLKKIACKKVISVPVILVNNTEFNELITCFYVKLQNNPIKIGQNTAYNSNEETYLIQQNHATFQQIVQKRIQEGLELIDPEAVDKAIKASGGILRQFISILHEAARHNRRRTKSAKVTELNIGYGIKPSRLMLERSVVMSQRKIALLNEIRLQHKTGHQEQDFQDCLLGNQILIYMNEPLWYSINPLIEETVRIYAEYEPKPSNEE